MKSVLISIKPKWCEMIAYGKKTVEIRKTRPKLETPFKCYIYCTSSELLTKSHSTDKIYVASKKRYKSALERNGNITLSGKVIGEFVCDKIEKTDYRIQEPEDPTDWQDCYWGYDYDFVCMDEHCLTKDELYAYGKKEPLYGWNIFDLVIYDKPKELSEFYRMCPFFYKDEFKSNDCLECKDPCGNGGKLYLTKPPQSWCYVEGVNNGN